MAASGLVLAPFDGKPEQARVQTRSRVGIITMWPKFAHEPKKYSVPLSSNLDINPVTPIVLFLADPLYKRGV